MIRKARLGLYRGLNQTSKAFSLAAHLVNPNQGTEWWRMRKERLTKESSAQAHHHDR